MPSRGVPYIEIIIVTYNSTDGSKGAHVDS